MTWRIFGLILLLLVICDSDVALAQQKSESSGISQSPQAVHDSAGDYDREDLGSLSLGSRKLHSVAPFLGEKDEYPDFTRELIQVQWRSGDAIDLYVIKPRGTTRPPAIMYLYSYPSETDRFRDDKYCQKVTASGYAAVGFVSAFTGQRYHDRPMKEWFVSQFQEALTESVHDVQMILDYLATRGDLDMDHIGIFSQGSGATIAILAASVEPRIQALDAIQPWGDWSRWMATSSLIPDSERSDYLKADFLLRIAPLDPVNRLRHLETKSVHLQFVLDDSVTPAAAVKQMMASAPSRDQVVEYQTKREQYDQLAGGKAFDWIKKQLRTPGLRPPGAMATGTPATTQGANRY